MLWVVKGSNESAVFGRLVVAIYRSQLTRAANDVLAVSSPSLFWPRFTRSSSLLIKLMESITDVIFACSVTLVNA